jgi:hypothetical protein
MWRRKDNPVMIISQTLILKEGLYGNALITILSA